MHEIPGYRANAAGRLTLCPPDLSGMHVLAADDNAVNRFILSRMLALAGADAVLVNDGREAVDVWKSQRFDLLLLDISMPNMDGISALAAIRDHEVASERSPPLALAVTAHTMGHELRDYLAVGFSGTVPKPLRLDTLYDEIRVVLAQRDCLHPWQRSAI